MIKFHISTDEKDDRQVVLIALNHESQLRLTPIALSDAVWYGRDLHKENVEAFVLKGYASVPITRCGTGITRTPMPDREPTIRLVRPWKVVIQMPEKSVDPVDTVVVVKLSAK